jgi:hypothetical protein
MFETASFSFEIVPWFPGSKHSINLAAALPRLRPYEQRDEIEAAFIGWRSTAAIAEEYGLAERASIYRHAHALGLFPKRQRNIPHSWSSGTENSLKESGKLLGNAKHYPCRKYAECCSTCVTLHLRANVRD